MVAVSTKEEASLLDLSCIIICENSEISGDLISAAQAKGLNLLRTSMTEYETCVALGQAI